MCGTDGGDVDVYARRSMQCGELVINGLVARLAGCELSGRVCTMGCWCRLCRVVVVMWDVPAEEELESRGVGQA